MATTARGFPYVLPGDAIVDWPSVSLALATLLENGNDEHGYAPFTATVAISATTEATAQVCATLPSITFPSLQVVEFEFYSPQVLPAALAGAAIIFVLWDNTAGVSLGLLGSVGNPAAAVLSSPALMVRRLTPAAGARIYSVRAYRTGGNGSVVAGAGGVGAFVPGYLKATVV